MGKQSIFFLGGEGAAWIERNKDKIDTLNDPIIQAIRDSDIPVEEVLEIGCANGWRLKIIRNEYGCPAYGVDPGYGDINIDTGTADDLDWKDGTFNVVIYGFCLYLCDREDLFKIVLEGDRVLQEGGYLIIWDFHQDFPYSRPYEHKEGLLSYKMDYSKLWLANPAYYVVHRRIIQNTDNPDDRTAVTILKKDTALAWQS
jgi:SAM-dependent methyltransferase